MENPGQGGSLNHLGVEVPSPDAVDAEQARLAGAGLTSVERAADYLLPRPAGQVLGAGRADGERWEICTVLEDSPTFWGQDGGASWATAEAALDAGAPASQPAGGSPCCGTPEEAGEPASASPAACC